MSIDTIERLETEIAEEKEALRANVDELQDRAREVVSWRTQVQRHPFLMLGAAALGGVLLAILVRPSPGMLRRVVSAAGALAPAAGRVVAGPMRKALHRRASDRDLPRVKRVVRDARRKASQAASRVADRLSVPTAWEGSGARRTKHHPA